jgi:hypothetical protein
MAVPAFGSKDRTGFVAGVMNLVAPSPPTADDLVGRLVLVQAKTRFEAVSRTGGEILGHRPLDVDGLVAVDPHDYSVGAVHRVWGWHTILDEAERLAAEGVLVPASR